MSLEWERLAHFRHTVGTLLAEMGEHQFTIRDYLRHANLTVTNKYLQATAKSKRHAQDKLVEAILPKWNPEQGRDSDLGPIINWMLIGSDGARFFGPILVSL